MRDYMKGEGDHAVPASGLGGMISFLKDRNDPMPRRDAVIEGLKTAVRNWRRERWAFGKGSYWYGEEALKAWREDIGNADSMTEEERDLLRHVGGWNLVSLIDARKAATVFLEDVSGMFSGKSGDALTRASECFAGEAAQIAQKVDSDNLFLNTLKGVDFPDWTEKTRRKEQDLLHMIAERDAMAISFIEEALVSEGIGKEELEPPPSTRAAKPKRTATSAPKILDGLEYVPKWVSHLGALMGCLNYLERDVSTAWVYGATGHAFVLNIHEALCPSGPTAWNTAPMYKLQQNLGCDVEVISASKKSDRFKQTQKAAWDKVRAAIDEGHPCYGWELQIPDHYAIIGYDDVGYHYSGPPVFKPKGPKPWQELGDTNIGWLEVCVVKPAEPADDAKAVLEALEFALEFAEFTPAKDSKWEKFQTGLAAYDQWINAFGHDKATSGGAGYNAQVWSECRNLAVEFLEEAKGRLDSGLSPAFDNAIAHYSEVARNLKTVAKLFPVHGREGDIIKDKELCGKAIEALKSARKAEESGLQALQKIVEALREKAVAGI